MGVLVTVAGRDGGLGSGEKESVLKRVDVPIIETELSNKQKDRYCKEWEDEVGRKVVLMFGKWEDEEERRRVISEARLF